MYYVLYHVLYIISHITIHIYIHMGGPPSRRAFYSESNVRARAWHPGANGRLPKARNGHWNHSKAIGKHHAPPGTAIEAAEAEFEAQLKHWKSLGITGASAETKAAASASVSTVGQRCGSKQNKYEI